MEFTGELRWVFKGGAKVLQQRAKITRLVRREQLYVSDPYYYEAEYVWMDVPNAFPEEEE